MTAAEHFPWFHPAMLIRPNRVSEQSAWKGHIPFAAWIVAVTQPTVLVELGTHWGDFVLRILSDRAGANFAGKILCSRHMER